MSCKVAAMASTESLLPKFSYSSRSAPLQGLAKSVRSFGELSNVVNEAERMSADGGTGGEMSPPSDQESTNADAPVVEERSLLDAVMLSAWEDRAEEGLFKYDVTACPTKVLPGAYGFIAQLNEGRAQKKRQTEFRVDQVVQDFDDSKFNFKKAGQNEVLFQFCQNRSEKAAQAVAFDESAAAPASPNLVFINVSPIEYGHVLLVPRVNDNLQQLIDGDTMLLALEFTAFANNPYFRVGFNSLGAYASINHLHFQGYYLAAPFAVERAPTLDVSRQCESRPATVRVSVLEHYPIRGVVLELMGDSSALGDMAGYLGRICGALQAADQPFNLFIADCGARVFLLPQDYAAKQAAGEVSEALLDTGVNPACFELAGHMVMKRRIDYDNLSQTLCWQLLAKCSLSQERFQALCKAVL